MSASRRIPVDMEATRLVFVMLKGAKPMRKVAIPITDSASWHTFEGQVKAKLRIRGIQAMTMASTGEVVTSLSQLQDIDQVHVIEAADIPAVVQPVAGPAPRHQSGSMDARQDPNGTGAVPQSRVTSAAAAVEDGDAKYTKRKGFMSTFLSSFRQASLLPITTRDHELPGPRRSRRKLRILTPRNAIVALCILLVLLLTFRLFAWSAVTGQTIGPSRETVPVGGNGAERVGGTINQRSVRDVPQENEPKAPDDSKPDAIKAPDLQAPDLKAPKVKKPRLGGDLVHST